MRLAMLWGFFDESGFHEPRDQGGRLKKLTVAGAFAPFGVWEALSLSWSSAIAAMGIPLFHMADFEARQSPFKNWTQPERENRLNALLEIIGNPDWVRDIHCYGFTNLMRPEDDTSSIYKRCVHDLFIQMTMYPDEEFALVFAHHPEFGRHSQLLIELQKRDWGKTVRSLTIAQPIDTCPLQAADIIAYEVSRHERHIPIKRYPLARLEQLGCTFRLCGSVA